MICVQHLYSLFSVLLSICVSWFKLFQF
uniref:Uncharacterized protein n=1 Tax=Arundo donax TaxID=35708 RepID=A0A0A8Y9X9_ARUDO